MTNIQKPPIEYWLITTNITQEKARSHMYMGVRGGWTRSNDMKSKWSRATNSQYLMYSSIAALRLSAL